MQTIFQLPGSLSAPLPVVSGAAPYPPFEGAGEDGAVGEDTSRAMDSTVSCVVSSRWRARCLRMQVRNCVGLRPSSV